jgi:RNA polymerase sigma factor (sigma-70 family)
MAISPMTMVFRHLRRAVIWRQDEDTTDGQLLKRFLDDRDEAAFEALVLRHGPMVLGVCRRVLGNVDDAEDAFQAAFLVLVRRAGAIARAELLGNWLHGVAYRTALAAKGKAIRRRSREKQVKDMPHPAVVPEADGTELVVLLDQELHRLPDKYRVPVVLCDLEGGARKDVAQQLGLAEGTLSSRLATARKMLARRLARHGLPVSAAALATAFAPSLAPAGLPAALVQSTVSAASCLAAGKAMTTAVSSARVVDLMERVRGTMVLRRIKVMLALLMAFFFAAGGLLVHGMGLGAFTARQGTHGSETRVPATGSGGAPQDEEAAARKERELRAAQEAAEKAAREAAAKKARAEQTPTTPTPSRASKVVDFEEVSIAIRPFPLLAVNQPESIRVLGGSAMGDGFCEYRIEERPARGELPRWDPAYQGHKLDLKQLRRLEELLKKTNWLTAPGHEGKATHTDATTCTLSIKRKGKTRTITIDGEKDEPYQSLLAFFRGIAHQENLLYRLERLPGKERFDACRQIEQYVLAEKGRPYGKPPSGLDLQRYVPTCQRYVRNAFTHSKEELLPALHLLGYLRIETEREYIAALANDRDMNIRGAVAEALGMLGGKESVTVLRRMIRSTPEAPWELIRLGPIAVPTIVQVIESGTNPFDERDPTFLDYERQIRAYLDHWDQVPRPIDPRVLEAVRKSMAVPKIKAHRIQYHKMFLDRTSGPAAPPGKSVVPSPAPPANSENGLPGPEREKSAVALPPGSGVGLCLRPRG